MGDGGLQVGEECDGGEVDGCHVGVVGGVPFFGRLFVPELVFEGRGVGFVGGCFGSGHACRGDEEIEVFFFLRELGDEVLEGVFGGYVAGSDSVFRFV